MTPVVSERQTRSSAKRSLRLEMLVVAAIALLLIFVVPLLLSGFRLNLLGRFLALAIAALGIDLIWGYTGMLSLGHGVFFTLGGYALGMHMKLQLPAEQKLPEFMMLYEVKELPWFWVPFHSFPFTVLMVVVFPAIVATILGYLIFRNRIRGVYFSILTQATTIIFFNFFNGQLQLFNGTNGLTDFQRLLGFNIQGRQANYVFYVLSILFLIVAYALCRWLTSGKFGRLLIAIRDDENRTRFSGYDPTGYKVLVFAVSAALAGIAGALFTLQTDIVSPNTMNIAFSIEMVIWVAVGGRGTLAGAVLGAVLVNFARSLLSERFPEIWLFFQGGLFLIIVLGLPYGILGWLRSSGVDLFRKLTGRNRVETYPSLAESPEAEYEKQNISK